MIEFSKLNLGNLINVDFKLEMNGYVHNEQDEQPELEYPIVGFINNFGEKRLPGFEKQEIIIKKSNRGRKKKEKQPKIITRDNGNGKSFRCQTTYAVYYESLQTEVSVKISRKNAGHISKVTLDMNDDDIKKIINIVLNFINKRKNCNIELIEAKRTLCNSNFKIIFKKKTQRINLFTLTNIFKQIQTNGEYKELELVQFNGEKAKLVLDLKSSTNNNKYCKLSICSTGTFNIQGNNDPKSDEYHYKKITTLLSSISTEFIVTNLI